MENKNYRPPINNVPDKTILRHVLRENEELKAENEVLKEKVERQEKAITAFKEWQSKVAERSFQYWLSKGAELMKEKPSKELLRSLRQYLLHRSGVTKKIAEIMPELNSIYSLLLNMNGYGQTLSEELEKFMDNGKED